ncbi:unnamed protein product [Clonostachys chloroleuca]|uniref:Uncharacterized protein n=1 Tax=Clonostachys chloroleuca TaxID=1926264 RepID=A0AA35QG20_9HYPO|nr:unnamed protein product [Clonostachys chloroleuca]
MELMRREHARQMEAHARAEEEMGELRQMRVRYIQGHEEAMEQLAAAETALERALRAEQRAQSAEQRAQEAERREDNAEQRAMRAARQLRELRQAIRRIREQGSSEDTDSSF